MDESFVSVAPVGADEVKNYKIHVSIHRSAQRNGIQFAPQTLKT